MVWGTVCRTGSAWGWVAPPDGTAHVSKANLHRDDSSASSIMKDINVKANLIAVALLAFHPVGSVDERSLAPIVLTANNLSISTGQPSLVLMSSGSVQIPVWFEILGVCVDDDLEAPKKSVEDQSIRSPTIIDADGELQRRWMALTLPTYYVLDRDHVVRYRGSNLGQAIRSVEAMFDKDEVADLLRLTIETFDKNRDRRLEKSELPADKEQVVDAADSDRDRFLSIPELMSYLKANMTTTTTVPRERDAGDSEDSFNSAPFLRFNPRTRLADGSSGRDWHAPETFTRHPGARVAVGVLVREPAGGVRRGTALCLLYTSPSPRDS